MLYTRILYVVLAFFFLFPHIASSEKIVQSSGIGVILKGDVEAARGRALKKAMKGAVREAVASLFYFSDLENFNQAVEELLAKDPLDYIDRYRFLSDLRDENLYKVEMEISVSEEKIKKELVEIGLIEDSLESLQLGILIGTKINDPSSRDFFSAEDTDFTAFAAQQCRTRGFFVLGGSISVDDSPKSFEKLRINNQLTALQGRRLGADAVVLGLIEISSEESRLGMQLPGDYRVSLWVRAIRSRDAALLGIRENEFTLKQNISKVMLWQLIYQNLDSLLADLGEDIRENMS